MKRRSLFINTLLVFALTLSGCTTAPSDVGWTILIDGAKGLDNWNMVGDANWREQEGAIVADKGSGGFLVSKDSYKDFTIYAEFWAATDTNSGIFMRITDLKKIASDVAYEVNIWDIRPEPSYGTGAIVNVAKVPVPIVNKAGGQWNVMEVTAKGTSISVKLNGNTTAIAQDAKFPSGPIALQFGPGVNNATGGPIKWRKVMIKPI